MDENGEEIEVVKTIGRKKMTHGEMQQFQQDDDALIEEFLNSNADKTICTFFMQGNCKYADRCKFLHPTGPPDYNHLSE